MAACVTITACTTQRTSEGGSASTTATSSTSVPTTTLPPTTSTSTSTTSTTSSTTTTTTTLPWQQFPTYDPEPLPTGEVPVISRVDTTDPVVFITLDDGFARDPAVIDLLREHGAVVTMFPVPGYVDEDPDYFREVASLGGSVNSHTMHHVDLTGLSLARQTDEFCSSFDSLRDTFGSTGVFVRPPFGNLDLNTRRAAARCGARAIVLWRVVASEGYLSTWGDQPIHPGDIILMHFRPTLYWDLLMVFNELDRLGLTSARLEDYLVTE